VAILETVWKPQGKLHDTERPHQPLWKAKQHRSTLHDTGWNRLIIVRSLVRIQAELSVVERNLSDELWATGIMEDRLVT
jgi:hypothetical protein